jgi:hypothetical protein
MKDNFSDVTLVEEQLHNLGVDWSVVGNIYKAGGQVRVIAQAPNGDIYVGGVFSGVVLTSVTLANNIIKWNSGSSSWEALGTGVSSFVYAIAFSGTDVYVGGNFTTAGGNPANYIAKWDGTSWSNLGSGCNGAVNALAFVGTDLYVGGGFTLAGGVTNTARIARWDGSAWNALSTGCSDNTVYALAVSGTDLYVGGSFNLAGGVTGTSRIAKWSSSAWSALATGCNNQVSAILLVGSDIYVGGTFTLAGGVTGTSNIARWDSVGSTWNALGTGITGGVQALAYIGSDIYIGGTFTSAGGTSGINRITKWDGSTYSALGTGCGSTVYTLKAIATDVYVGGLFTSAGGVANTFGLAKWDGSQWLAVANPATMGTAFTSLVVGSDLYVAGDFSFIGDLATLNIAKWNGSSWSALGTGCNGIVYALTNIGTDVYAGGAFTLADNVTNTAYVAKWDGSAWSALSTGCNGNVRSFKVSGSDLYVGGSFTLAGGTTNTVRIAKWDGSVWSALGTGFTSGTVYAIIFYNSSLYAGGDFTGNLSRWTGSAWVTDSVVSGAVYTLADYGSYLYLGGAFSSVSSIAHTNYIAKYDGTNWSSVHPWGANSHVRVLAVYNGHLYVGGLFSATGGGYTRRIARWDGVSWSPIAYGIDNQDVYSLSFYNNDLYAFGNFTLVGGVAMYGMAKNSVYAVYPSISDRTITLTDQTVNSVTVNWAAASDDTPQSGLQYLVYKTTTPLYSFDSVGYVETVGTPVDTFAANITSKSVTGLTANTKYYFNVIVKDADGNKAAYHLVSYTPTSGADTIPPVVSSKTISIDSQTVSSLRPVFNLGTDSSTIQYLPYISTNSAMTTIEDVEANGTIISGTLTDGGQSWRSGLKDLKTYGGSIYAMYYDSITGDLYVGGSFVAIENIQADNIARWNNATGAWESLGLGILGTVYSIVKWSGNIYIGGSFSSANAQGGANSVSASNIIGWNGNNWFSLGSGCNSTVRSLVASGSYLYAGGDFSSAGGVANTGYIARWNGGSWSAMGTGATGGSVQSLLAVSTNIYVGGQFTVMGGVSNTAYFAKWDGSAWSSLGLFNQLVSDILSVGTDLYVTGAFTTVGSVSASRIARWDGTTWYALGVGLNSNGQYLAALGTDVYVAGNFSRAGTTINTNYIAKWNGSDWFEVQGGSDVTFNRIISGSGVLYLSLSNNGFGGYNGLRNLLQWDGNRISQKAIAYTGGYAKCVVVSGSDLYVGGSFNIVGDVEANNIAKWNGSSWSPLGAGCSGIVHAITISGTDLYAAGQFIMAGEVLANRIAKWNGSSWSALGTGANNTLYAVTASGSDVYIGGSFTSAGGVTVANIAKWDGTSWSALSTGCNNVVYALLATGTDVFAGGQFSQAGGIANTGYFAKWSSSAWSAVGTGANNIVYAIKGTSTDLYIGGSFSQVSSVSNTGSIAKWNGTVWSALGSGGGGNQINAMALSGSDVYVGGNFTSMGGSSNYYVAKWNGTAWSSNSMSIGVNSMVNGIAIDSNGVVCIGGQFHKTVQSSHAYVGYGLSVYTPTVKYITATGLTPSTTYYVNVIAKDSSNNKTLYTRTNSNTFADTTPPTVGGGGTLTSSGATATDITINWTKATDNYAPQGSLQYLLYRSTGSNLNSVANIELNGTPIGSYAADISSATATGLSLTNTIYYFNVIVKDTYNNKSAYTQLTVEKVPPVAGNSGVINTSSVAGTSLSLSWSQGNDNATTQMSLQYLPYYSTSSSMDSIAQIEANGIALGGYSTNLTFYNVTGLTSGVTYYFNVIVRDAAGNKTAYAKKLQATLDSISPTISSFSISEVTAKTMTLTWSLSDNTTTTPSLAVRLVRATTAAAIDTIVEVESMSSGSVDLLLDYTTQVNTYIKHSCDLTPNTTYYYSLVAKDLAGNKAIAGPISQTTAAESSMCVIIGGDTTAINEEVITSYMCKYDGVNSITTHLPNAFASLPAATRQIKSIAVDGNYTYLVTCNSFFTNYNAPIADFTGRIYQHYQDVWTDITPVAGTALVPNFVLNATTSVLYMAIYDSTNSVGKIYSYTPAGGSVLIGTGSASSKIHALALAPNGDLYAGGDFTSVGGVSANNIIKWNGTTWSALGTSPFSGSSQAVRAIDVNSSSVVYAGGESKTAWRFQTGTWTQEGTLVLSEPITVLKHDPSYSRLYVGAVGLYRCAGGSTWYQTDNPAGGGAVASIAILGTDVYVGKLFSVQGSNPIDKSVTVSCVIKRARSLTVTSTAWAGRLLPYNGQSAYPGIDGYVMSMYVSGSDLYMSGAICASANGAEASLGLTQYVGANSTKSLAPYLGSNHTVRALGNDLAGNLYVATYSPVSQNTVYTKSIHAAASNTTVNSIAKWNGTSWTNMGSGYTNTVHSIAIHPTTRLPYFGGYFTTIGGVAANRVAMWNGSAFTALGSGFTNTCYVLAFATKANGSVVLLAGGDLSGSKLQLWDGSTWNPISTFSGSSVLAIEPGLNGDVFIGGKFTYVGSDWSYGLCKYNVNTGVMVNYSAAQMPSGASTQVFGLKFIDGALYMTTEQNNLYRFDGTTATLLYTHTTSYNATGVAKAVHVLDRSLPISTTNPLIIGYEYFIVSYFGSMPFRIPDASLIVWDGSTASNLSAATNRVGISSYNSVNAITSYTLAPTVSLGTLTVTNITGTGFDLSWAAATCAGFSNLQYRVYISSANMPNTIDGVELYGTPLTNFENNITSKSVSYSAVGSFYVNIVVKNSEGGKAVYTNTYVTMPDLVAPIPGGSGSITTSGITQTQITLSWLRATDNYYPQNTLQYLVYYSTSSLMDSVADIKANGTVGSDTVDSASATISLSPADKYYLNVLVKDSNGNESCYQKVDYDMRAPIAGGSGTLVATSTLNSIALSFTKAIDAITPQANLQYRAYYSANDNIKSVDAILTNGTVGTSWLTDVNSVTITGLSEATNYYLNLIVKDGDGYQTAYQSIDYATADGTAPVVDGSSLHVVSSESHSCVIKWSPGADNKTQQSALQYRVYYSSSSSKMNTVADIVTNGTAAGGASTAAITQYFLDGLLPSKTYYINVIVKDESNNPSCYDMLKVTTPKGSNLIVGGDLYAVNAPPILGGCGFYDGNEITSFLTELQISAESITYRMKLYGDTLYICNWTAVKKFNVVTKQYVDSLPGSITTDIDVYNGVEYLVCNSSVKNVVGGNLVDFVTANSSILLITINPTNGNIYLAGYFTQIAALSISYLAMWNGSAWSAVGTHSMTQFADIKVINNVLYVIGKEGSPTWYLRKYTGGTWTTLYTFSTVNYTTGSIVEYNGEIWVAFNIILRGNGTTFAPWGTPVIANSAITIAFYGSNAYVGTAGTHLNGSRGLFKAPIATGVFENLTSGRPSNSQGNAYPSGISKNTASLIATSDGIYFSGGAHSALSGASGAAGLCRKPELPKVGGIDNQNFEPYLGSDGTINTVVVNSIGHIYIAGSNITVLYDAQNVSHPVVKGVHKWNGSSWTTLGTWPTSSNPVQMVLDDDEYLYAVCDNAEGVYRWNGTSWSNLGTVESGATTSVLHYNRFDGHIYVGGKFTSIGPVNRISSKNIAKWDGTSWVAMSSSTWVGSQQKVFSITSDKNGVVYIGTDATSISGVTVNYIARWLNSTWTSLGSLGGYAPTGMVTYLTYFDDTIIVKDTTTSIKRWDIISEIWSYFFGGASEGITSILVKDSNNAYALGSAKFYYNGGGGATATSFMPAVTNKKIGIADGI